jgi:hypothetical protein
VPQLRRLEAGRRGTFGGDRLLASGTGLAKSPLAEAGSTLPGERPRVHNTLRRDGMSYEKPSVKRYGSLRELTLGGGAQLSGDATNLYHRS